MTLDKWVVKKRKYKKHLRVRFNHLTGLIWKDRATLDEHAEARKLSNKFWKKDKEEMADEQENY